MVAAGDVEKAVAKLLSVEKKARLALDSASCARVVVALMQILFEQRDFEGLNAHATMLTKRRSQSRRVIQALVRECVKWVDDTPDKATMVKYIETLRTITTGKIFVEVERARLTQRMSKLKEEEGQLVKAAEILQEAAVETYGAMEKREKTAYILEQMRLTLAVKDFVRCRMVARKVNKKVLGEAALQDLKLRFYDLLIQFHTEHDRDTLQLAQHYYAIYSTPGVQENDEDLEDDPMDGGAASGGAGSGAGAGGGDVAMAKADEGGDGDDDKNAAEERAPPTKRGWKPALRSVCVLLALSPYSNHQSDMVHRVLALPKNRTEALPNYIALLKHLTTKEIAPWPLPQHPVLCAHSWLAAGSDVGGGGWVDKLHLRITQHNVRVVAGYYSRMRMQRLAELVDRPLAETEQIVADMVSGSSDDSRSATVEEMAAAADGGKKAAGGKGSDGERLYAKIDRPAGVVVWNAPQAAEETVSDYAENIKELLRLVEKTTHLIDKENMMTKIGAK